MKSIKVESELLFALLFYLKSFDIKETLSKLYNVSVNN